MKSFTQKTIGLLVSLFTTGITVHAQQIGEIYQGGYIFQINEDGTGLVAAMENLEGTYEWGCYGEIVNGADGQAIGTGHQNTLDIVNQGCTTESGGVTAAQAALDAEINGYGDWYLPSKDELKEIYNTIGIGGSDGNIGGFDISFYWSSTEYFNNFTAWFVSFTDGYTGYYNGLLTLKNNTYSVRVIRSVTFGEEMVLTECGPDEYESMAPTSSTDRECSALSICSARI
ncbi:DUF1566 domain-containing protein [Flavobacteriales bacterium]|nr:DUF1566 domain-containing protein [Flavobacteriales bacterium]